MRRQWHPGEPEKLHCRIGQENRRIFFLREWAMLSGPFADTILLHRRIQPKDDYHKPTGVSDETHRIDYHLHPCRNVRALSGEGDGRKRPSKPSRQRARSKWLWRWCRQRRTRARGEHRWDLSHGKAAGQVRLGAGTSAWVTARCNAASRRPPWPRTLPGPAETPHFDSLITYLTTYDRPRSTMRPRNQAASRATPARSVRTSATMSSSRGDASTRSLTPRSDGRRSSLPGRAESRYPRGQSSPTTATSTSKARAP